MKTECVTFDMVCLFLYKLLLGNSIQQFMELKNLTLKLIRFVRLHRPASVWGCPLRPVGNAIFAGECVQANSQWRVIQWSSVLKQTIWPSGLSRVAWITREGVINDCSRNGDNWWKKWWSHDDDVGCDPPTPNHQANSWHQLPNPNYNINRDHNFVMNANISA